MDRELEGTLRIISLSFITTYLTSRFTRETCLRLSEGSAHVFISLRERHHHQCIQCVSVEQAIVAHLFDEVRSLPFWKLVPKRTGAELLNLTPVSVARGGASNEPSAGSIRFDSASYHVNASPVKVSKLGWPDFWVNSPSRLV